MEEKSGQLKAKELLMTQKGRKSYSLSEKKVPKFGIKAPEKSLVIVDNSHDI